MAKREPSIPDSQLAVLQALWRVGKGTVREVLTDLEAHGYEWSYATVTTLLGRLEQSGLVACDKTGFAYVYRPVASEPDVVKKRVRKLVDKLYGGEPGLLVLHLLESHELSDDHRRQIRKLLDQVSARGRPTEGSERTRRRRSDDA